jgi:hypothetical protein
MAAVSLSGFESSSSSCCTDRGDSAAGVVRPDADRRAAGLVATRAPSRSGSHCREPGRARLGARSLRRWRRRRGPDHRGDRALGHHHRPGRLREAGHAGFPRADAVRSRRRCPRELPRGRKGTPPMIPSRSRSRAWGSMATERCVVAVWRLSAIGGSRSSSWAATPLFSSSSSATARGS